MNGPERDWNEEQVEGLLRDFFRHELPENLRTTDGGTVVRQRPPRPTAARRDAVPLPGGIAGLAAAALGLMLAVAAIRGPSDEHSRDTTAAPTGDPAAVRSGDGPGPAATDAISRRAAHDSHVQTDADDPASPVERRTDRGATPVFAGDDEETLEQQAPELMIEILPIDD